MFHGCSALPRTKPTLYCFLPPPFAERAATEETTWKKEKSVVLRQFCSAPFLRQARRDTLWPLAWSVAQEKVGCVADGASSEMWLSSRPRHTNSRMSWFVFFLVSRSGAWGKDLRVIEGTSASEGEFPWMAAVLRYADSSFSSKRGQQFCGGTLIDPDWILTAAHCVADYTSASLSVVIGATDLDNWYDESFEIDGRDYEPEYHQIAEIVSHPGYNESLYWRYTSALKNFCHLTMLFNIMQVRLRSPPALGAVDLAEFIAREVATERGHLRGRCWLG